MERRKRKPFIFPSVSKKRKYIFESPPPQQPPISPRFEERLLRLMKGKMKPSSFCPSNQSYGDKQCLFFSATCVTGDFGPGIRVWLQGAIKAVAAAIPLWLFYRGFHSLRHTWGKGGLPLFNNVQTLIYCIPPPGTSEKTVARPRVVVGNCGVAAGLLLLFADVYFFCLA